MWSKGRNLQNRDRAGFGMVRKPSILCVFILSGVIPAIASQDQSQKPAWKHDKAALGFKQRIDNGGFEQGLVGWKVENVRLVVDPLSARGGTRCVVGQVQRSKTGAKLLKKIWLRSDKVYRLELWVKADNHSRLTIWRRSGADRVVLANWQNVPSRWRRYRVHFTVDVDGPSTLQIIAPSSFWAPTGRMWVDDVSLYEMPRWGEQHELSTGGGFNDFPSLAAAGPDTSWAAWVAFKNGRDSIQVARLRVAQKQVHILGRWGIVNPSTAKVLGPTLVSDGTSHWLIYSSEQDKNWDLHAVVLDEKRGPQKALRITDHPGVDVYPAGVIDADTLWIAWESNRDQGLRQIYLTAVRRGVVGRPIRLSTPGTNNHQPAMVSNQTGDVRVAWHSFRKNNMDLYSCVVTDGIAESERRMTHAAGIDRGVRLASIDRQVWMAWEHVTYNGYKLGKAAVKRVQIARIDPIGLMAPYGLEQTVLGQNAESPDLCQDVKGGFWVSARVPRDKNSGWDVFLWRVAGSGWSGPKVLSTRKGMNRRSELVISSDSVLVAYQADDLPGRWLSVEQSRKKGSSGVLLSRLNPKNGGLGNPRLEPYEMPEDSFDAAGIRLSKGEDRTGWSVSYEGRKLNLYFGDLHEHSDFSVCERTRDETPDQSYQMMRDLLRVDFGGLTDHGKCFNPYLWHYLGKLTRANHDAGRFLTFLAQEWTSSNETRSKQYPFGYYGHRNLIFEDAAFPNWYNAAEGQDPRSHRKILERDGAEYVLIPHQLADTGNVPMDWSFHDESHEPVAEIYQMRGSYECKGCLQEARLAGPRGYFIQDAWEKGIVIGVIASPDHEGGAGKAAVYAPELSRRAILDAIRNRSTYATTGAKIFLDVRVNGMFMGQVKDHVSIAPIEVEVHVDCPRRIKRVDVLRNNRTIFTARGAKNRMRFRYLDDEVSEGRVFYYVRVVQRDGEMAWSSPVWLHRFKPKSN